MENIKVYPIVSKGTKTIDKLEGDVNYWSFKSVYKMPTDITIKVYISVVDFGPTNTKSGEGCVIMELKGVPLVVKSSTYTRVHMESEKELDKIEKELLGSSRYNLTTILRDLNILKKDEEVAFK